MFVFNKYHQPFKLKLISINNFDTLSFKNDFNYKIKIIHGILLYIYSSIYYNNVICYKNKFKRYNYYNIELSNYFNAKILLNSLFG
jgi:hypothetical protein